jgi:phosphatidylglycerol---prolipoprotein diacylglyceryl transferase
MFPIHLNLGFRTFYYYEGFYFFLSILIATLVAVRALKKAGLDANAFLEGLVWILLGAFLGARLFHFAFWDSTAFFSDPAAFFRIWEGGMSITGGLAGGVLAAWFCFRRVDFWRIFAATSPALLLGQAIGRMGCFLNGDAWGIPTNLPWGVAQPKFGVFLPGLRPDTLIPSDAWTWSVAQGFTDPASLRTVPLHPTQLYEACGDLALAGLVILLAGHLTKTKGPWPKVGWLHLGGYSLLRCGLEFLHGDRDITVWAGMTALQIGLLGFAAASTVFYARSSRNTAGRLSRVRANTQ